MKVITIEPGIMKTPLFNIAFDKEWCDSYISADLLTPSLDKEFDALPEDLKELYGREFFTETFEFRKLVLPTVGSDPQLVCLRE
jgi:hypothetical protein